MSTTTDTDDDSTVYVTTIDRTGKNVYHTAEDCDRLGANPRPRQRDRLAENFKECAYCADDLTRPDTNTTECPYCGATVGQLPHHIREDCEVTA